MTPLDIGMDHGHLWIETDLHSLRIAILFANALIMVYSPIQQRFSVQECNNPEASYTFQVILV